MNKLVKKLILSSLTLAFAVVALGTTTFAWFTLSQEVSVENIQFNVAGTAGLKIAVTGLEGTQPSADAFKEVITSDDIKALNEKVKLELLSATEGTDGAVALLRHQTGKAIGDAKVEQYIKFKLWFEIENIEEAAQQYNLVPTYTVTAEVKSFKLTADAGVEEEFKATKVVSVSAANALRIARTHNEVLEVVAPEDAAAVNLGGHAERANSKALTYFHNTLKDTASYKAAWGVDGIELPSTGLLTDEAAPEKIAVDVAAGVAGTPTKEYVSVDYVIYLDGWDADAFDAIIGQAITINLKFILEPRA